VLLFVLNGELMEDQAAASYQKPAALIWLCHSIMFTLLGFPAAKLDSKRVLSRLTMHSPVVIELALEYFVCNYLFVCALPAVGLAETNAVYQAGIAFVYVLSVPLLGEQFSIKKSLAVGGSIIGFVLLLPAASSRQPKQVAPEETTELHSKALGWGAAICASAICALYKVRCKQALTDPGANSNGAASALRLLGLLGGSTLFYLWPVLLLLHVGNIEPLEPPSNIYVAAMLMLIAVLAVAVNLLSTWSLALSSPLFMSLGFAFSIPIALLADVVLRDASLSGNKCAGMLCILCSLVVMAKVVGDETKAKTEPLLVLPLLVFNR